MRVLVGLIVFLLLIAVGLILPQTVNAKPAGDKAFLVEYSDSVQDLVKQVEDSRLIALRYAKHFKVDPLQVLSYFRNELSIEELKENTTLDVYYRKGLTEVETKSKEFKKGTKVFVNRNGIPILELGTGNPLADTLPGKDVKKLEPKSLQQTLTEQPTTPTQPTTVQTPPGQPGVTQPPTAPGSTPPLGDQTLASAATTEPETQVLASGPVEVARAAGKGFSRSASGWLLPVGLLGAVALGAGGGGGSPAGTRNEPPPVVPEPSGLIALSVGVMTFAGAVYRRRIR